MRSLRLALAFLAAVPFAAANATVLYKSVDENGVVMFSDMPPPAGARILEERHIISSSGTPSFASPEPASIEPLLNEPMLNSDAILARATASVDEAERALAEARRARGPILGPVRPIAQSAREPSIDDHRIEEQKRAVKVARQRLMEVLRDRRIALARR